MKALTKSHITMAFAVASILAVFAAGQSVNAAPLRTQDYFDPIEKASVAGSLTMNTLTTTNKSATLSGTMPASCTDLELVLFSDAYADIPALYFESSVDAGFTKDVNGNWSINLATPGYILENGYYDAVLLSKCGVTAPDEYAYQDIYYDALKLVPAGCDAACEPVHRFYNFKQGVHFYTANEDEKRYVMTLSDTYRYEAIFSFARATTTTGLKPVHRFYNFKQGVHFYTSNQAEATKVNDTAHHTYRYEGVAYYTSATQVTNTAPVHRFYNFKQGVHFFTSNQAEATNVNNTAAHTYRYEGIANYNVENK